MRKPLRRSAAARIAAPVLATAVALVSSCPSFAATSGEVSTPAPVSTGDADDTQPKDRREWIEKMVALPADNVQAALDDPSRSEADRARDAAEKAEALLRASGVARDTRVGDVRTGDGWFARLLLLATRRSGRVYAANDPDDIDSATAAAWTKRLAEPVNADIARADGPLAAGLPGWVRPLDLVFHRDAVHEAARRGLDPVKMHAGVLAVLRAGGRYVVVDHRAADGESPAAATKKCRADESSTRAEVEAAGFRFVSSSDALDDTADDRRGDACGLAGGDRFLLVFEKPSSSAPR